MVGLFEFPAVIDFKDVHLMKRRTLWTSVSQGALYIQQAQQPLSWLLPVRCCGTLSEGFLQLGLFKAFLHVACFSVQG